MKLWLIEFDEDKDWPDDFSPYSQSKGFVVRAETEADARKAAQPHQSTAMNRRSLAS